MRKRSEYTRITILAVAKDLFAKNGYNATSLDTIAEKANTTKKTIYGYFTDKRELFAGVIDEVIGFDFEAMNKVSEIRTMEDVYLELYSIAKIVNELLLQPRYIQLMRVVISEINTQPDLRIILERGVTVRSYHRVVEILSSASDNRLIQITNIDVHAKMFLGNFMVSVYLNGFLDPTYSQLHKYSHAELIEHVNIFLESITKAFIPREQSTTKASKYGI